MGNVFTYLTEAPIIYDNAEGKCVNISTTIGVFRIPREDVIQNPGEILEKISTAYRTAKAGGNERIVFYNDSQLTARSGSMKVQQMFPEALRNEEFKVYYQPKVHTGTGRLIGAEALCRWFHNDQMISPGEFITVLEETDDICKLDFYMLDHVCRDIRRWLNQGMKVVRVSVNLSRKHMVNQNLLDKILKIIDRRNIPHNYIEIELTETTTDVNFADLKRVVGGLQEVEVYTSVDDFGVGYHSLNLLRELPWNVVKVDRSFLPIDGEEYKETNDVMFNHVVSLAKDLGLECIVEGVETPHHMNILLSNNCDIAQGYLFDRPLPVEEFENRLEMGYYDIKEHLKQ
jgi:EAL domain-containing protein (putative c-di-GMP-specific phosphodiesterase class I)